MMRIRVARWHAATSVFVKQFNLLSRNGYGWLLIAGVVTLTVLASISLRMYAASSVPSLMLGDTAPIHVATATVILGALWPLLVWRRNSPAEEDYQRSIPVDHSQQDLARVLAGAAWLISAVGGCVATHLLLRATLPDSIPAIGGFSMSVDLSDMRIQYTLFKLNWAGYVNLFTGPLFMYLATTTVAWKGRRPLSAVLMTAIAIVALFAFVQALRIDWLNAAVLSLIVSSYGLATVTAGALQRTALVPMEDPMRGQIWQGTTVESAEWIAASVLWFSVVIVVLYATSRRRSP